MKDILLVRHGEAEHTTRGLTGGWPDSRLTDLGRHQAALTGQRLAEVLRGRQFRFHCSDVARAAETSQIIAHRLGVQPTLVKDLREIDQGEAAGMSLEEARRIQRPVTEPCADWVPYPGAESWRDMTQRIFAFMDAIAQDEEDLALIVTHSMAGVAVIHWWLGLPEEYWSRVSFDLDHCSISRLTVNRWGERTLSRLNDVSHLQRLC
jgi:broad specificity phosphatase PhoE